MYIFLDGHKHTTTGSTNKMALIDGEVWMTLSDRKVGIYHIFGQESTTEVLIDLSTYFTNDPYYITKGVNSVFIFERGTTPSDYDEELIVSFVEISTLTREVIQHVTLLQTAHCYPVLAKGKLWFTTPAVVGIDTINLDAQSLFFFDTTTKKFSANVPIVGNKQFRPHKITWGKGDFIYVAGFNEVGVYKFNVNTGAFIIQILVNRKPTDMLVNSNRELLVASYNGMVSVIDQTNDTFTNSYAVSFETESIVDDGTYLWSVAPALERVTKTLTGNPLSHEVIKMDGGDLDFSIEAFSETAFNEVLFVPAYNHNEWDVENEVVINKTEAQHIVVSTDTNIFVATELTDSWDLEEIRPYELSVTGTAMVVTGNQAYFGEST